MRRSALLCACLALAAAACGGDGATTTVADTTPSSNPTTSTVAPTTTQPPVASYSSDDGRVTIEVPPGALPEGDPGIVITSLGPDEQPAELGTLDVKPWVYRLEPEKLTFDAPVTVTMSIPFDEFASEGFDHSTPLATLVTTRLDGAGWELLGDLSVSRDGESVILTGTTDHFSRLAAVPEQVFIETRFLDVVSNATASFDLSFTWSNGSPLQPPDLEGIQFQPAADGDRVEAGLSDPGFTLACPPQFGSVTEGDLAIGLILKAVSDSEGATGLVSTPRLTSTSTEEAKITVRLDLRLVCRPTISDGGTISMTVDIDHPQGNVVVAGEDFRGGLSAEQVTLHGQFPTLYGGLIHDTNPNGTIDGADTLFPPFLGSVDGNNTVFVLPLFGFGDYFNYFVDVPTGDMPAIETAVTVSEGATILLGELIQPEQTSVPFLGDLPFIGRVFSDETSTTEDTELLVFLTPRIVQNQE